MELATHRFPTTTITVHQILHFQNHSSALTTHDSPATRLLTVWYPASRTSPSGSGSQRMSSPDTSTGVVEADLFRTLSFGLTSNIMVVKSTPSSNEAPSASSNIPSSSSSSKTSNAVVGVPVPSATETPERPDKPTLQHSGSHHPDPSNPGQPSLKADKPKSERPVNTPKPKKPDDEKPDTSKLVSDKPHDDKPHNNHNDDDDDNDDDDHDHDDDDNGGGIGSPNLPGIPNVARPGVPGPGKPKPKPNPSRLQNQDKPDDPKPGEGETEEKKPKLTGPEQTPSSALQPKPTPSMPGSWPDDNAQNTSDTEDEDSEQDSQDDSDNGDSDDTDLTDHEDHGESNPQPHDDNGPETPDPNPRTKCQPEIPQVKFEPHPDDQGNEVIHVDHRGRRYKYIRKPGIAPLLQPDTTESFRRLEGLAMGLSGQFQAWRRVGATMVAQHGLTLRAARYTKYAMEDLARTHKVPHPSGGVFPPFSAVDVGLEAAKGYDPNDVKNYKKQQERQFRYENALRKYFNVLPQKVLEEYMKSLPSGQIQPFKDLLTRGALDKLWNTDMQRTITETLNGILLDMLNTNFINSAPLARQRVDRPAACRGVSAFDQVLDGYEAASRIVEELGNLQQLPLGPVLEEIDRQRARLLENINIADSGAVGSDQARWLTSAMYLNEGLNQIEGFLGDVDSFWHPTGPPGSPANFRRMKSQVIGLREILKAYGPGTVPEHLVPGGFYENLVGEVPQPALGNGGPIKRDVEGEAIVQLNSEDLELLKGFKGFDDFISKTFWPMMEKVLELMDKGVSDKDMTGEQLLEAVRTIRAAVTAARRPEEEDHRSGQ